jgi:hypothetical protein
LYEDPDHVFMTWHENASEQSRVVLIRGRLNRSLSAMGGSGHAK